MSRKLLDVAIVSLATCLLLIIALGGIDYDWGVVQIRLHSISRPALLLAAALAVRAWTTGITARFAASRGFLTLLLATSAVYATYHVRVCGGLDSYGYVSTASLIASGRLTEPQPLVQYLPFGGASSAVAPLGYVAGTDGHTQVPRFPLGLPLVMAVFKIFGTKGPFFVPIVTAYITIVLAFLLAGRAEAGGLDLITGLFAAAIVAIDPVLVDYGIQPMSDVPATCWLLAALWLRLAHPKRSAAAGLCAGMAFFTRPVLLVAAVAIGVVTLDRPLKETVRFAAVLWVFVLLQMAINLGLYGSVNTSGYGPASYMFEISGSRLAANAQNFARGLTYSHTAAVWLLWPVALFVQRRSRWAWQISGVAAAAALPYLFYLVFEGWDALRFVLPAIVLVLILAARAAGSAVARFASRPVVGPLAPIGLLLVALVCAAASHRFLQRERVYDFGIGEAKYELAGDWIKAHTPERAVVFAGLHSGSIRFYGNRETIRWDQIPSDKLSPTLHNLEAAGYPIYLALDTASEPPLFTERFSSDPAVQTEQIGRVRVVNFYRFLPAN